MTDEAHCSKCKQTKPLSDFYLDRVSKMPLSRYCKLCSSAYYKEYNARRGRTDVHPIATYSRVHMLRKKIPGITDDELDKFFVTYTGICEICGKHVKGRIHVDHDEITKTLRGWLCSRCNLGIGSLLHDVEILKQAIIYLEKHKKS